MPPMDRRTLLTSGAALTAAALAAGTFPDSASGAVSKFLPPRADRLVDSFGVCLHLNYRTTVYGDAPRVIDWVQRLGARHVRSRLSPSPYVLDAFAELARRGIDVQGQCGAFGDPQKMSTVISALRQRFAEPWRVVAAFEGINEPNNNGVPWIDETRAKTKELYTARSTYGLDRIPIVAPALARVTRGGVEGDNTAQQAANLGSLASWVDLGNMHVYPQGRPPSQDIATYRGYARLVAGDVPVMCTEGGYFTAMDYQGAANPVPPEVAAVYAPQHVLEHWRRNTLRFFRYQLLEYPDAGTTDREGTLGTVSTADGVWQPKPDFAPVNRLLTLLGDPGNQTFTRRALSLGLRNGPTDLRSSSFVKRDGTHVVALWLDRYLWQPIERRMLVDDLYSPLATVDVDLGETRDVVIENLVRPGVTRLRTGVSSLSVGLPAGVTILSLS